MLNLSQLKKYRGMAKKAKRIGRGTSSGKGCYSTKGQKGQRARAGGRNGLKIKGIRPMIRQFPKNSGFASLRQKIAIINLSMLEKRFSSDEIIDSARLFVAGLIKSPKTKIKVLGSTKLSKKLNVVADAFSASAKEAIIKAGGEANVIEKKKKTYK